RGPGHHVRRAGAGLEEVRRDRPALLPAHGGGPPARRSEQREAGAGLAAEGPLPRTHRDDGEGRRGGRPLFGLGPSAERVADMSARPVTVVLGARGTLGSALAPVLERAGWDVAA